MTDAVSSNERGEIEDLLTEFYWRLDHPDTGTVADLCTDSATLVTPRFELSGREEIANWFAGRTTGVQRITRHSWSNLRLRRIGDDRVSADARLLTAATTPSGGVEILFGDTTDLIVRQPGVGWRFCARRLTIAMQGRLVNNRGDGG